MLYWVVLADSSAELNVVNTAGFTIVSVIDEEQAATDVNSPDSAQADRIAPTTPDRTTASSKAADLAFNQSIVTALASQLAHAKGSDTTKALLQAEELILAADSFPHARHLLLLALLQACHRSVKPSRAAATILRVVNALWADLQASAAFTGAAPAAGADEQGIPTAAHFKQWEKKAAKSHAAALQHVLLVGLQHISPEELQSLPGKLVRICLSFLVG